MKRLTDQEKIEVVEKYQQGLSSVELGKLYGISHVAILGLLKRRSIKIRTIKK